MKNPPHLHRDLFVSLCDRASWDPMFGGLFLRDPGGDVGTGCSALGFCWTHKQAKPFLAIWRGRSPSSRRQQSATEELSNVIFNFNLNSNINIRPVDTINLKEQRHRHQPQL